MQLDKGVRGVLDVSGNGLSSEHHIGDGQGGGEIGPGTARVGQQEVGSAGVAQLERRGPPCGLPELDLAGSRILPWAMADFYARDGTGEVASGVRGQNRSGMSVRDRLRQSDKRINMTSGVHASSLSELRWRRRR